MLELRTAYGFEKDEAASLPLTVPFDEWSTVVETQDRWFVASGRRAGNRLSKHRHARRP